MTIIAPDTPEARLVRAATPDALLLNALDDHPSGDKVAARLYVLSEVAVRVLRIAGLSVPSEFHMLMTESVAEVGPYPEPRSDIDAWHVAVLGAVNKRLAAAVFGRPRQA